MQRKRMKLTSTQPKTADYISLLFRSKLNGSHYYNFVYFVYLILFSYAKKPILVQTSNKCPYFGLGFNYIHTCTLCLRAATTLVSLRISAGLPGPSLLKSHELAHAIFYQKAHGCFSPRELTYCIGVNILGVLFGARAIHVQVIMHDCPS